MRTTMAQSKAETDRYIKEVLKILPKDFIPKAGSGGGRNYWNFQPKFKKTPMRFASKFLAFKHAERIYKTYIEESLTTSGNDMGVKARARKEITHILQNHNRFVFGLINKLATKDDIKEFKKAHKRLKQMVEVMAYLNE